MIQKTKNILKSDIGKSISTGYLLFILNNVAALFLTPYMLEFISKEEYGLYILCVDFLAWVGFMEFGTNKVIESKAGHLIANNDDKGLNRIFNASFYFQIIVAVLIFPFFYFLVKSGIGENELKHLNIILIIFSISAALSVFRSLYSAVIVASKKIHLDNRINLFINLLNYLLILSLVPFIGVVGLAIINALTVILILIRSRYRIKKLFPQIIVRRAFFDKGELKQLFSLGMYFSLGSIATLLLMKIDSFVIGKEFGIEQIAYFYITIKLFMLTKKIFEMFLNNFRPHISQLYGNKKFENIHRFYILIAPISFSAISIVVGLAMIFNQLFVSIWVGESFFISSDFNILFGYWILLETFIIIWRIILIPSLYKIKSLNLMRFAEAIARITLILVSIKFMGINILPLSSILVCVLFGVVFFSIQIQKYFNENGVAMKSRIAFIPILLTVVLFLVYIYDLIYIFPYVLLCIGVLVGIVTLYTKWYDFKKLNFLIK